VNQKKKSPSRVIVTRMYKNTKFGYAHSPWKGKFIIPHDLACKEAQELTQIRKSLEKNNNKVLLFYSESNYK